MIHRVFISFSIVLGLIICCNKNPKEADVKTLIWDFSTPEAQQMNPQLLDSAFSQAESSGFIDGLLIIRDGFIVGEKYFNEYNEDRPHNIMSVSKSFLSAITGITLQQGYINSLEEKVLDFFPEYIDPDMDPTKRDITIRHLLTMRMGIQGESEDDYSVYWGLYSSDNWIKATIESPLVSAPGEKMRYNTFQTHLLSAIITRTTQKSAFAFATEFLLNPMKIDVDSWEQDPQGVYFGGNAMYFTSREMAVLGALYLNDGRLNDIQIIPHEWIALTLSPSTDFTHPNEWGGLKNYNYAYLWWLGQMNDYDMFMGYGYGGQFVIVFPGLNLIVVSTARFQVDPETSTIQEWTIFDIVTSCILPAVNH